MKIDAEKLDVTHNSAENRFETWIEGQLSKLDYLEDDGTIVMTHVGVYPEHREQGVAGKLTKVALEYAKEKSLRVIPMCPYIAAYIRRNPEYVALTSSERSE